MCYLTVFLIGDYGVQINVFNAAENISLYLRVALFKLCNKMFDLKSF